MRNEKYLSYEAYQKCCIFEGLGAWGGVCVGGGARSRPIKIISLILS